MSSGRRGPDWWGERRNIAWLKRAAEEPRQRPADAPERLADVERRADGARDQDEGFALRESALDLLLEPCVLAHEPPPLEHATDDPAEPRDVHGLREVTRGASLDRL